MSPPDNGHERAAEFVRDLARAHARVAITGGPGIGKSTVMTRALTLTGPDDQVPERLWIATDVHGDLPWAEQRNVCVQVGLARPRWVMEGVTVARALRHGLPADAVVVLHGEPLRTLPKGALLLHGRVEKWVNEAAPGLAERGVPVYWIKV